MFGARLRITALRAPRGPGIEFLEYLTPPGGRALPADTRTSDLIAWTTQLRSPDFPALVPAAEQAGGKRASILGGETLVRDPDGHLLLVSP